MSDACVACGGGEDLVSLRAGASRLCEPCVRDAAYAVTESRPRVCHGCGASHDVVHLVAVGAALLCPACVVAAARALPADVAPRFLPSGAHRVTYAWDGPNGWVFLELSPHGEHWSVHVGYPREWTPGPRQRTRHVNWLGGTLIIWET